MIKYLLVDAFNSLKTQASERERVVFGLSGGSGGGYSGYAVKGAILGRFIAGNIREKVGVCFVLDISCSSLQKLTEHRYMYMYMQCVESVSLIYRNFPEQVRYSVHVEQLV